VNNALFIGWGDAVRGREQKSLQVFGEAIQYWEGLRQRGEVESFETYILTPHGGDLAGFLIARGDPEKLANLQNDEEFIRINTRAQMVVEGFGVVTAATGENLQHIFEIFGQASQELG
jgi:hypothetical protein